MFTTANSQSERWSKGPKFTAQLLEPERFFGKCLVSVIWETESRGWDSQHEYPPAPKKKTSKGSSFIYFFKKKILKAQQNQNAPFKDDYWIPSFAIDIAIGQYRTKRFIKKQKTNKTHKHKSIKQHSKWFVHRLIIWPLLFHAPFNLLLGAF